MKIKNNSCGDIDLSKIILNCCGNEAITVIPCSEYLDSRLPNTGKVKSFFKDAIKPPIVIVERRKETLEEALKRLKEECKPELIKAANATGKHYHDLWVSLVPLILKFNPKITA